jgi:hypothetical protein
MILLNRNQMKQLRKIFKDNKEVEEVMLNKESKSGIGPNLYADYVNSDREPVRVDISDYASW